MSKAVQFLLYASRSLAVCAVIIGVAAGLLSVFTAGLICVDYCGERTTLVAAIGQDTVLLDMTPCIVLEMLTLAAFLAYCLATRQAWRAAISLIFLVAGGLLGIAVLNTFIQQAATLPVGDGGFLIEPSAVAWEANFGWARTLAVGIWAGVPALIQWHR